MKLGMAGLAALAICGLAGTAHASTIDEFSLARPEGLRHYVVVQPDKLARTNRPLVILLHGNGSSAEMMIGMESIAGYRSEDWIRLAERERVLLIAPDGSKARNGKRAWNDCRADASTNTTADDVGFIAELIDTAIARLGADPERIYVFGSSNGGAMAYRLAIEMAPRLAAIGVQSALMPAQSRCRTPATPVSVFVSHGTADPVMPYGGGAVGNWVLRERGTGIGAEESVAVWRRLAGFQDAAQSFRIPHLDSSDPTSAVRYVWGHDPARVQVEFLRIDGGGHVPASKADELPWWLRKLVGNMNRDVDLAEEAWIFFRDKRAAARP